MPTAGGQNPEPPRSPGVLPIRGEGSCAVGPREEEGGFCEGLGSAWRLQRFGTALHRGRSAQRGIGKDRTGRGELSHAPVVHSDPSAWSDTLLFLSLDADVCTSAHRLGPASHAEVDGSVATATGFQNFL